MSAVITAERPDTPEARFLIDELQTHLESFYPAESRHGFNVERYSLYVERAAEGANEADGPFSAAC